MCLSGWPPPPASQMKCFFLVVFFTPWETQLWLKVVGGKNWTAFFPPLLQTTSPSLLSTHKSMGCMMTMLSTSHQLCQPRRGHPAVSRRSTRTTGWARSVGGPSHPGWCQPTWTVKWRKREKPCGLYVPCRSSRQGFIPGLTLDWNGVFTAEHILGWAPPTHNLLYYEW